MLLKGSQPRWIFLLPSVEVARTTTANSAPSVSSTGTLRLTVYQPALVAVAEPLDVKPG